MEDTQKRNMRVIKKLNIIQKLEWVTWNWFAGCKDCGGIAMLILGIMVSPLAIIMSMFMPVWMTCRPGVNPPDKFFKECTPFSYKSINKENKS